MKSKIVFSNSGGATKFISLIEGNRILIQEKGVMPTDVCGISAGSIAAFITCISINKPELFDIAINLGLNLTIDDIFKKSPINKNGSLKIFQILGRILRKKPSMGVQDISKIFLNNITPEDFYKYQNDRKAPNCWVMAVRPMDMKRGFWNLKDKSISFDLALQYIYASSVIPVMGEPILLVDIDENTLKPYYSEWVDGGIRNHNPSPKFIDMFGEDIKELYSFYTREDKINMIPDVNWSKNILSVLGRVIDGMLMELSKRDSQYEVLMSEKLNFKLLQFFYPGNILETQFDTDKKRLFELYNQTKAITNDIFK